MHEMPVYISQHDHIIVTILLLMKPPFKGSQHIYNIPQVIKYSHIEHLGTIGHTLTFHHRRQKHIQH